MGNAKLAPEKIAAHTRELMKSLRALRCQAQSGNISRIQRKGLALADKIVANALADCDRVQTRHGTRQYDASMDLEGELEVLVGYLSRLAVPDEDIAIVVTILREAEGAFSRRVDTRTALKELRSATGRTRGALKRMAGQDTSSDQTLKALGKIFVAAITILADTAETKPGGNFLVLLASYAGAAEMGREGFGLLRDLK